MVRNSATGRATLVWLLALGCAVVPLGAARVAQAQVSVGIEVAPEVTVEEPEEVAAETEPPEPVYEEAPPAPAPGFVWVGGYWGWTGIDWAWYPGRWLMAPEGRVYVEPYYERVGGRVVYVHGYWGVPGARRSYGGERIVFAPVRRPPDYRRGEPVRVERQHGAAPGARPATFYVHANGPARPLPQRTQPARMRAAPAARPAPAPRPAPQSHRR